MGTIKNKSLLEKFEMIKAFMKSLEFIKIETEFKHDEKTNEKNFIIKGKLK